MGWRTTTYSLAVCNPTNSCCCMIRALCHFSAETFFLTVLLVAFAVAIVLSIASHSIASHSTASHSTASHSIASHSIASHSSASHSTASRFAARRSTASRSLQVVLLQVVLLQVVYCKQCTAISILQSFCRSSCTARPDTDPRSR